MGKLKKYDLIVIGTGAMGSSACYYAAKAGKTILGIDQYSPPHAMGSHSGNTRIVRMAYFEHPDYVPLLQKSYKLWSELEKDSKFRLFHKTGLSYYGKSDSHIIEGVKRSTKAYMLKTERDRAPSPALAIPDEMVHIHEPNAGYVDAEKVVTRLLILAKLHGAEIIENTPVITWKKEGKDIIVTTKEDTYVGGKLIITAGAWTSPLLPNISKHLRVTKQSLFWVEPKDKTAFTSDVFPCWILEDPKHNLFYGFPLTMHKGQKLIKIVHYEAITNFHPNNKNRTVSAQDKITIQYAIDTYFPNKTVRIVDEQTCLYTNSTDQHFIVDFAANTDKQVVFGTGFSGHGFKFAPVMGYAMVQMALKGKTELPIQFISKQRIS